MRSLFALRTASMSPGVPPFRGMGDGSGGGCGTEKVGGRCTEGYVGVEVAKVVERGGWRTGAWY